MNATSVDWASYTWNPLVGCSKVSPGCRACYAEVMAHRLVAMGEAAARTRPLTEVERAYPRVITGKRWNGQVVPLPSRFLEPLHFRPEGPGLVFVNSMSDLGAADPETFRRLWAVMMASTHLTFLVLTKRTREVRARLDEIKASWGEVGPGSLPRALVDTWSELPEATRPPRALLEEALTRLAHTDMPAPNVWLGASVESQECAYARLLHLATSWVSTRVVSAEPLLGPLDLRSWLPWDTPHPPILDGARGPLWAVRSLSPSDIRLPGLDWLIVGGESAPRALARPLDPAWVRTLREQARAAGVPFFFKQWGALAPDGAGGHRWVGKGKAGYELDGATWRECPPLPEPIPVEGGAPGFSHRRAFDPGEVLHAL